MEFLNKTAMKVKIEIECTVRLDDPDLIGDVMDQIIFEPESPEMEASISDITIIDWEVIEEEMKSKLRAELT